jgi:hypothetical protein
LRLTRCGEGQGGVHSRGGVMKRQAREVPAIKSDTLKVAVDKATIYLSPYIDQFQPEKGLEDNRRISDGGTVELYSQIVRADPDAADKWIVNMIRAADDGDAALDRGLRAIAASLIEKGEPLPEALRGLSNPFGATSDNEPSPDLILNRGPAGMRLS